MSKDVKGFRKDKASKDAEQPDPALLTRAEAAGLLRCSISSVRRLEGDGLHPIVGADGVHRFVLADLVRVSSDRLTRPIEGSKEGERDARVFEALDEGKGLREIVTTLRLPADLASKLHASWLKMGSNQDMILSAERLARLSAALQANVRRPSDLVEEVEWLAEQCNAREAERSKLDDQITDLMSAIGKVAVRDSEMAKALPALSSMLVPDLAKRLETVIKYHVDESANSQNVSQGATSEGVQPAQVT